MTSESQRLALADEFERHIKVEDAILKEYHVLADQLPDGPLSVLINHITTEEEMHHFLLATLAEWLRSTPYEGPSRSSLGADREEIVGRARVLQEHELTTIEACRALKSGLKGDQGDFFEALLDILILDSQKHHRLLRALERVI
ncbi:MAG: hypothetical protein JRE71_19780 [Deltaproteobacteria bacterium]|nr:hypothetical protein [Deltaproteobacteria bacterium]